MSQEIDWSKALYDATHGHIDKMFGGTFFYKDIGSENYSSTREDSSHWTIWSSHLNEQFKQSLTPRPAPIDVDTSCVSFDEENSTYKRSKEALAPKEIDWSKAPDDATHGHIDKMFGGTFFYKDIDSGKCNACIDGKTWDIRVGSLTEQFKQSLTSRPVKSIPVDTIFEDIKIPVDVKIKLNNVTLPIDWKVGDNQHVVCVVEESTPRPVSKEIDCELKSKVAIETLEKIGYAYNGEQFGKIYDGGQRNKAAGKTLERMGYRYNGGELWKPPQGSPPAYICDDIEINQFNPGKILIKISRKELIKIISSISPSIDAMKHPLIKGSVDGSYGRWSWCIDFDKRTDEELVTMLALLT